MMNADQTKPANSLATDQDGSIPINQKLPFLPLNPAFSA
jgi:hypothetical protein